jgi:hypothetical protein
MHIVSLSGPYPFIHSSSISTPSSKWSRWGSSHNWVLGCLRAQGDGTEAQQKARSQERNKQRPRTARATARNTLFSVLLLACVSLPYMVVCTKFVLSVTVTRTRPRAAAYTTHCEYRSLLTPQSSQLPPSPTALQLHLHVHLPSNSYYRHPRPRTAIPTDNIHTYAPNVCVRCSWGVSSVAGFGGGIGPGTTLDHLTKCAHELGLSEP